MRNNSICYFQTRVFVAIVNTHKANMRQNGPLGPFLDGSGLGRFIRVQNQEKDTTHAHPAGLTCLPLALLSI